MFQHSTCLMPSHCNCEEAQALKRAGREKLNMKVIKLSYRDEPQLIRDLLHQLAVARDHIEGEPEEVLRVWTTPDGLILGFRTEPARKLEPRIDLAENRRPLQKISVDLEKLVEEIVRRRR